MVHSHVLHKILAVNGTKPRSSGNNEWAETSVSSVMFTGDTAYNICKSSAKT